MEEIWVRYGQDMEKKEEDRTHHTTLSHHFTQYFMEYMVHCSFDHLPLPETSIFVFLQILKFGFCQVDPP